MQRAARFTFGPYRLDKRQGRVEFQYSTRFADGTVLRFTDALALPPGSGSDWSVPDPELLTRVMQDLLLMFGIEYWKLHCAPAITIEGFELDRSQAAFWNTVYTEGLGEFYYRSGIDFRGLVSFPFTVQNPPAVIPRPFARGTLVTFGGGKDSILTSELLAGADMPFDLFSLGWTSMQENSAKLIGKPLKVLAHTRDPQVNRIKKADGIEPGYPSVFNVIFAALLMAALGNYRYILLSNEKSSDFGNLEYLGLRVNHQWSKSAESERLIREYIATYISPDIVPFSLLRGLSELETTKRFSAYKKYFFSFSSCNRNFIAPAEADGRTRAGHAYWCNACPKCAFMFAALAAFVPKREVVDIFGEDLFAKSSLLPTMRRLLGLEGFKPFECVGEPDEMAVAMWRASERGEYRGEPAMQLFEQAVLPTERNFPAMEREVLATYALEFAPAKFSALVSG